MKRTIRMLFLAVLALSPLGSAQAQYGDVIFHYCYVGKPPYSNVLYFSEAFGVPRDTYETGIRNAFHGYIAARHDPEASAGGQCMGPYETRNQAENALNEHIAEARRDGKGVVLTWWRYRGD
jgi:hypothetical protein